MGTGNLGGFQLEEDEVGKDLYEEERGEKSKRRKKLERWTERGKKQKSIRKK